MTDKPPHRTAAGDGACREDELVLAHVADELGPGLLDELRGLDVPEPRNRLAAVVRARVLRRTRYRGSLDPWGSGERVQAVAVRVRFLLKHSWAARLLLIATLFAGLVALGLPRVLQHVQESRKLAQFESVNGQRQLVVPTTPGTVEAQRTEPDLEGRSERLTWLSSENDLRRLQVLCDERGKVTLRRRLLKLRGADTRTREWIESLAADVARDLARMSRFDSYAEIEALSLGLRALLGAGSTTLRGPHASVVRRSLDRLEALLPELSGVDLATALAGYLEGALVTGDSNLLTPEGRLQVVARHLHRFTREQFDALESPPVCTTSPLYVGLPHSVFDHRAPVLVLRKGPGPVTAMDSWTSPLGALADAGLLLRIAPALGVPTAEASRVRSAFFAHLAERGNRPAAAGASARAAMLFSYSDMGDRDLLRESLRPYCLNPDLFGRDLRAVHYLAWGIFPGAGWARFTLELRYFTANHEGQTPIERASLLLVQLLYTSPGLPG